MEKQMVRVQDCFWNRITVKWCVITALLTGMFSFLITISVAYFAAAFEGHTQPSFHTVLWIAPFPWLLCVAFALLWEYRIHTGNN